MRLELPDNISAEQLHAGLASMGLELTGEITRDKSWAVRNTHCSCGAKASVIVNNVGYCSPCGLKQMLARHE